jgi:prepilin-type N-terminal cleavage/methylation domain-containing protein
MPAARSRLHAPIRGFTLIELLVVIAIIGTLSAAVLGSLQQARYRAQTARAAEDLHTLQTALELYYSDNGAWPPAAGSVLTVNTTSGGNWSALMAFLSPYINSNLVPVYASEGTAGFIHRGYSYIRGTNASPQYVITQDSVTGAFVACLIIRDGYWADFLPPVRSSRTTGDGGVDPDGMEIFNGSYTVSTNRSDCP